MLWERVATPSAVVKFVSPKMDKMEMKDKQSSAE
jgi:hypothetical protein